MAVGKQLLSLPILPHLFHRLNLSVALRLLCLKHLGRTVLVVDCSIPDDLLTAIVDQNSWRRIFDPGGSRSILLGLPTNYGNIAALNKSFLLVPFFG